ncbi:MAG: hypothetical protein IID61_09205 [SAR324 cluster bacterium]|nr:hypothetical protein [SAR324 cluster bacterium]
MAIWLTVEAEIRWPSSGARMRPTLRVEAPSRKQSKMPRSTWGARRTLAARISTALAVRVRLTASTASPTTIVNLR